MQVEFSTEHKAPRPRERRLRLVPELKAIQVGQSVLLDKPTALCLGDYLRRNGMSYVQRAEGQQIRIWRTA